MPLIIKSVLNTSNPDTESILLEATEAVNLNGYAIVDKTFDENGNTSNEFRHFFPFPKFQLDKGHVVALITGMTTPNPPTFSIQSRVIAIKKYFYWESRECVWNDSGTDIVSLIQYSIVARKNVPAVK